MRVEEAKECVCLRLLIRNPHSAFRNRAVPLWLIYCVLMSRWFDLAGDDFTKSFAPHTQGEALPQWSKRER